MAGDSEKYLTHKQALVWGVSLFGVVLSIAISAIIAFMTLKGEVVSNKLEIDNNRKFMVKETESNNKTLTEILTIVKKLDKESTERNAKEQLLKELTEKGIM